MDGDGHGCCGDDTETYPGIGAGMGMRVAGTVGNGYKYMSPCSSLVVSLAWRHVLWATLPTFSKLDLFIETDSCHAQVQLTIYIVR